MPSITQMVDVIAAHHVAIGEYFDSYADFKSDLDNYRQEEVTDATLMLYIDTLLSSSDYLASNIEVPHLVVLTIKENTKILDKTAKVLQDNVLPINPGKLHAASYIRDQFECLTIGGSQIHPIGSLLEEEANRINQCNRAKTRCKHLSKRDIAVEFIFNLAKERLILGSDPTYMD